MGTAEQEELKIYIENDGELYRQQHQSIIKNLVRKKKKGIYNSIGATRLYLYLVVNGAKKYARENQGDWKRMFSVKDRLAVAREFEKDFDDNYKIGEYD